MLSSSSSPPSSFPASAVAAAVDNAHYSATTMQALPGPGYISARSAEVILSDVRPIKLKPEALQSVNVLLDEFLYSILSVSRSLATDKLKAALLKVLPTNLGKEALLEAEVELKAYWERTTSARSPNASRNGDHAQFDLQWSFEVRPSASSSALRPVRRCRRPHTTSLRSAPASPAQVRSLLNDERL